MFIDDARKSLGWGFGLAIVAFTQVACGPGGVADGIREPPPTGEEAMDGWKCESKEDVKNAAEPLVVDWPGGMRGKLETRMTKGVAVVKYDCETIELLEDCTAGGTYGYMGMTTKEEMVRLKSADEVKANLPLSGLSIVAKIGAEMQRDTSLDIATVMVGRRRTTVQEVRPEQLDGRCDGASHFVRGAMVGAFVMKSGSKAKVETVAQVFGAGASAGSAASKISRTQDGYADKCKASSPDSSEPPGQCGALIRLELTPIRSLQDELAGNGEGGGGCPAGLVRVSGKCTKATKRVAYECKTNDPIDCGRQCDAGDMASCVHLSVMYAAGKQLQTDHKKAVAYAKQSCQAGFAGGCNALGRAADYGNGIKRDPQNAFRHYKIACDGGDPDGCVAMGLALRDGRGIPRDYKRAKRILNRACEGGEPSGCSALGEMYHKGQGPEIQEMDPKERGLVAVQLYQRSAAGDWPDGYRNLASLYTDGLILARDDAKARELYNKALKRYQVLCDDSGVGRACHEVAGMFRRGDGIAASRDKAGEYYDRACGFGFMDSCVRLALFYKNGEGGKARDVKKSWALIEKACEVGNGWGCTKAGYYAQQGIGRKLDKPGAAKFYEKACTLGDPSGCNDYGWCAGTGFGIPRDFKKARTLYIRSCDMGSQFGCYNSGLFHKNGTGGPRDEKKAIAYYRIACNKGYRKACEHLAEMLDRKNPREALAIHERACEQGSSASCYQAGLAHLNAKRGVRRDEKLAFARMRKSCDGGNKLACSYVGDMYRNGIGVTVNLYSAKKVLETACRKGEYYACASLGELVENGLGGKADVKRAFSLYEKSCSRGRINLGCVHQGMLYETGTEGVKKDKKKAQDLYDRACKKRSPIGCFLADVIQKRGKKLPMQDKQIFRKFERSCAAKKNAEDCAAVAFMYLVGKGTTMDEETAVVYLKRGCRGGFQPACTEMRTRLIQK